jgi:hypothetical protein
MTALSFALAGVASDHAVAQGYPGYPNTIMTPEGGTTRHREAFVRQHVQSRSPRAGLLGHEKFVGKLHRPPGVFVARGSSGSVLPTPLPRTQLIPPEGGSHIVTHAFPQEQGPTIVPGAPGLGPVPNLPHGPETFQDRASRCAFQMGLNNVPGTAASQYMGSCVQ